MSIDLSIDHPTNRQNFTEVTIGEVVVWFSYKTPIAVMAPGIGRVVRQNEWGPTTGGHLNHVDRGTVEAKARRVDNDRFAEAIALVMPAVAR